MSAQDRLSDAAGIMRDRAVEMMKPENNHPWGDVSFQPTTPEQWPAEVKGYLGGAMGEHCSAWTPAVALAVADVLDQAASRWEFDYDRHAGMLATNWHAANDPDDGEPAEMPTSFRNHIHATSCEFADGRARPILAVADAYLAGAA